LADYDYYEKFDLSFLEAEVLEISSDFAVEGRLLDILLP